MYIHPEITEEQAKEDRRMLSLWLLRTGIKVMVFFAVLGFALHAAKVFAGPLVHATPVQDLFTSAVKFGGYEQKCLGRRGGCPIPAVVILAIEDDNILGEFDPRNPTYIKVTTTKKIIPGSLMFNAILVHEFVHYLQWLFGELGPHSTCVDTPTFEEPAYKAAAAYLAQFGIVYDYSDAMFGVLMMAAMCQMEPM